MTKSEDWFKTLHYYLDKAWDAQSLPDTMYYLIHLKHNTQIFLDKLTEDNIRDEFREPEDS